MILKIKGKYIEWSNNVDNFTTSMMTKEELFQHMLDVSAWRTEMEFKRIMRLLEDKDIATYRNTTAAEFIHGIAFGENGAQLTLDEIYDLYDEEGD